MLCGSRVARVGGTEVEHGAGLSFRPWNRAQSRRRRRRWRAPATSPTSRRRWSPSSPSGSAKPVLVEGPAGVGKTELAKALSRATGRELIRLQCYEGLDEAKALYEWNYRKQLLRIQAGGAGRLGRRPGATSSASEFLLERPLMQAIASPEPVVLLIDEIDKTDQEFEAMLLELLSDFQITIPELGQVSATTMPIVVLTSNNSRELTEALKRRCLYLWLDYPELEREMEIVRLHAPELPEALTRRLVEVVRMVRGARPEEAALDRRVDRLGPHPAADGRRATSTTRRSSSRCRSSSSTAPTSTWSRSESG